MKLAVCDDSQEDRAEIKEWIEEYGRKKERSLEVREYSSGKALLEGKEWLRECSMVFLNIHSDVQSGLLTAKRLKEFYPELSVILISGRMGDALDGYRVKAARFLIREDLKNTLPECLDELIGELTFKEDRLLFSFVEGERCLELSDILYIETDRHKNVFYLTNASYRMYRKLDEIETQLAPYGFVRVHRSFLVNMRHIQKVSSYVMRLKDGTEISVPKSRYAHVKEEYAAYQEQQWSRNKEEAGRKTQEEQGWNRGSKEPMKPGQR